MGLFNWGGPTLPNDVEAMVKNASALLSNDSPELESALADALAKVFPGLTSAQLSTITGAFYNAGYVAYNATGYTWQQKVAAVEAVADAIINASGLNSGLIASSSAGPCIVDFLVRGAMILAANEITAPPSGNVEAAVYAALEGKPLPTITVS